MSQTRRKPELRKDQNTRLLDEIFLQPWFLPQSIASAIRRLIPAHYFRKMRYYYEGYGCLKCETKVGFHCSNGLCRRCAQRVRLRLLFSLKRRHKLETRMGPHTFTRVVEAQRLLEDLIPKAVRAARKRAI